MATVSILRRTRPAALTTALAVLCVVGMSLFAFAQVPATGSQPSGSPGSGTSSGTGTKPPTAKRAHSHSGKSKITKAVAVPVPVVTRPPDPPPPDWPVNAKAEPASVAWNGHNLSIAATNSSLQQILHDVSTATGLKVEGLASGESSQNEQRIYGSYGPAPARDVLSKLLDGSGYNVLMVGDQGEGTPRELVLTARAGGAKGAAAIAPKVAGPTNPASEEEAPEETEPPEPPEAPLRRPFNGLPSSPGRSQEMQQRQQMQPPQQQLPPGNQPPNNQPPNNPAPNN
jgi:hypothetical protein